MQCRRLSAHARYACYWRILSWGAEVPCIAAALQELRPLVHPLAQVLVGSVRLLPQPRYFPLHLRLIRALVSLGGATRLLLPAAPLLLDLLRWAALHKHVRAGAAAAAGGKLQKQQQQQGAMLLRASKAALATAAFQQDVVQQVWTLHASACMLAHTLLCGGLMSLSGGACHVLASLNRCGWHSTGLHARPAKKVPASCGHQQRVGGFGRFTEVQVRSVTGDPTKPRR